MKNTVRTRRTVPGKSITWVLLQIGIVGQLCTGYRINFPVRIIGRLVVPPGTRGEPAKTDNICTALAFKNELTALFCQKLVQRKRSRSIGGLRPVCCCKGPLPAGVHQVYRFLGSNTVIFTYQRFCLVEIDFRKR